MDKCRDNSLWLLQIDEWENWTSEVGKTLYHAVQVQDVIECSSEHWNKVWWRQSKRGSCLHQTGSERLSSKLSLPFRVYQVSTRQVLFLLLRYPEVIFHTKWKQRPSVLGDCAETLSDITIWGLIVRISGHYLEHFFNAISVNVIPVEWQFLSCWPHHIWHFIISAAKAPLLSHTEAAWIVVHVLACLVIKITWMYSTLCLSRSHSLQKAVNNLLAATSENFPNWLFRAVAEIIKASSVHRLMFCIIEYERGQEITTLTRRDFAEISHVHPFMENRPICPWLNGKQYSIYGKNKAQGKPEEHLFGPNSLLTKLQWSQVTWDTSLKLTPILPKCK